MDESAHSHLEFIPATDGLKIAVTVHEPAAKNRAASALPIVCLPGLTRNSRDFAELARHLAADLGRRVLCIDSRGRGLSDRDPDPAHYTVPAEAADVVTVLAALDVSKADFIGTSRGGLIIHVLAASAPALLGRIVFNDIGPVIDLDGMRAIRDYLDPAPAPTTRADIMLGLKRIHGPGFPVLTDTDWFDMVDALYRETPEGLIPDFDPAIAAAVKALPLDEPLPDLWNLFDMLKEREILVIRGELSRLLTRETVEDMARRHPGLQVHQAYGQGHAPLLHHPAERLAVTHFLGDPPNAEK